MVRFLEFAIPVFGVDQFGRKDTTTITTTDIINWDAMLNKIDELLKGRRLEVEDYTTKLMPRPG